MVFDNEVLLDSIVTTRCRTNKLKGMDVKESTNGTTIRRGGLESLNNDINLIHLTDIESSESITIPITRKYLKSKRLLNISSKWSNGRSKSPKWLLLMVLLMFLLMLGESSAGRGDRISSIDMPGDKSKVRVCPPAREIAPCICSVITKGLDVVCDHSDESHIHNALDVLKKNNVLVYWMKFRNCYLPRIVDYSFLGLEVIHLNIIRSNVSVIERTSLSALGQSLESLDLANNQLAEVPTAALRQQVALTYLNLNFNKIRVIHDSAFDGMILLQRLTLYENQIKTIHHNAFRGIANLMRLNLGKNNLTDIPSDSFHPLVNLEVLDIHENHIRHIPDAAFKGLTKLDMLKLEHNNIDVIQANVFEDLKHLNSLNIEHNKITNISDEAFKGLEANLGWLEMGKNQLDHIPSHALRPLHNLRQLDLDSNRIQSMQEDAFNGYGDTLKYIVLDKNHIKSIPPLALTDLHSLEWLKLAHNEITSLPEDTVQPILDTLKMLDVSNNPLVCSCDILWLRQWLLNPNNRDNIESLNEHMCVTTDRKAHVIKALPENEFNCPHPRKDGHLPCKRCPDGNNATAIDLISLSEDNQQSSSPLPPNLANEEYEVELQTPPQQKTSSAPEMASLGSLLGSLLVLLGATGFLAHPL